MRKLTTFLIALILVACSKGERGAVSGSGGLASVDHAVQTSVVTDVAYTPASGAPAEKPSTVSLPATRMIIRTAAVSIIVADTDAALRAITAATEQHGGYVNDSKVWRDGELLRANLSLRVPADKLNATLAAVRRSATRVQSETSSSQEVTEEFVDLESRVRNLEAAERELLQLMTTVREKTRKASDVLEMHQQITAVRAEIEQIRGRMRFLSQMTSMSTLNVEVIPDAIAKPVVEPGWQPLVVAKDAGRQLVEVLQSLATAAIWFAIYLLPVLLILGILAFIGWKVFAAAMRGRARYNVEA